MSPRRLLCLALLLVLLTTAAAADDLETTVTRMAKIGACISGVVNFETFFADTEPWMAAISTVEYEDPETEAQLLRDLSPIHEVDRVQAPTLVVHGANDTNTPVVEAEQVVENLKEQESEPVS